MNEFTSVVEDKIDCFYELNEKCFHIKNCFEKCVEVICNYYKTASPLKKKS